MDWPSGLLVLERPAEPAKAAGELHRPRLDRASSGAARCRQSADQGRSAPHRRQHRQVAGIAEAVLNAIGRALIVGASGRGHGDPRHTARVGGGVVATQTRVTTTMPTSRITSSMSSQTGEHSGRHLINRKIKMSRFRRAFVHVAST